MTPTINVNLAYNPRDPHAEESPVLLPCPIPRSVTFEVRLGECECSRAHLREVDDLRGEHHQNHCPARPVKVSCSISGKTWGDSEAWLMDDFEHAAHFHSLLSACRERWALVKALVLGHGCPDEADARMLDLFIQRDALFSELAALARDEQSAFERQESAIKAMGEATFMPDNFHRAEPQHRASASILAHYVARLIEQVGVL